MVGVSGLVSTLQTLPKDPSDPNSYSLIPVHAWSHNYSDVVEAARQLEALGGFEILRPDQFVAKLVRMRYRSSFIRLLYAYEL
jgi:hypothetical protein